MSAQRFYCFKAQTHFRLAYSLYEKKCLSQPSHYFTAYPVSSIK